MRASAHPELIQSSSYTCVSDANVKPIILKTNAAAAGEKWEQVKQTGGEEDLRKLWVFN